MATINTVYQKALKIDADIETLERRVSEYEQIVDAIKDSDTTNLLEDARKKLVYLKQTALSEFRTELAKTDKNMMFLSASVDNVMDAVKRHCPDLSDEAKTEIILKTLECASYARWQEIKKEAWGRNGK